MSTDTRREFHLQVEQLEEDLVAMGNHVERALERSMTALADNDQELAAKVIKDDKEINLMEHEIEHNCLRLLALQQPMASDLRVITTGLKIITDLERIGDHARDIAKITQRLENQAYVKPLVDLPEMAKIDAKMIREALTSFVERDPVLAKRMIDRDHQVDALNNQVFGELLVLMSEDAGHINQSTQFLFVSSHLERIGDHATNIGEWVIFMVTGERLELNN